MVRYEDFNFESLFHDKKFQSVGKIKEIKENNKVLQYKLDNISVDVRLYGNSCLKVDIQGNMMYQGLDIPHREPITKYFEEYETILPNCGENFRVSIKHKEDEILGPFMEYPKTNDSQILDTKDSNIINDLVSEFRNINYSESQLTEMIMLDDNNEMIELNFKIPSNFGIYGLGENFATFVKWGTNLSTFPRDNYRLKANQVYKGVPFFLSNAGIGIFFPTYIPMNFDIGNTFTGLISIKVPASRISFYILLGTPKDIIESFLHMTGKPNVPPDWTFGMWVSRWTTIGYKSLEQIADVIERFKTNRIPLDVVSLDPHWVKDYYIRNMDGKNVRTYACEFNWNRDYFKSDNEIGDFLWKNGKRLCLNVDPYVLVEGQHINNVKDCLLKDKDGKIALMPRTDDPDMPDRAMIDFTRKECFDRYSEIVSDLVHRSKVSALMTDLGEIVPQDAIDGHGNPAYIIRNKLGDLYQESAFQGIEKVTGNGVLWGRSGSIRKHNFPVEWGGDSVASWEGMRTSLRAALSAAMSGTIFTAFDSGGFSGYPNRYLYIRWVAMGALFSHFKIHGTTPREPWFYDDEVVSAFSNLVQLRYRLLPYIIEQAKKSIAESIPLIRPLILEFPDDPISAIIDDEYLLGDNLLVAPIFNSTGERRVYIPPGAWVSFYDRKVFEGSKHIAVREPISKIPLFVRSGSIIKMIEGVPGENVEETLSKRIVPVIF